MFARIRRFTLLTLIVATSAIIVPGDSQPLEAAAPSEQGERIAAQPNYGVRLRKLHLVRPDLIPYPLSLEVYC
jgi:hypothetical protein